YRRVFSHAFSDKSRRDQEATVIKYVDHLVIKLKENTTESLDMCKWFNLVCFDITRDLMFSDSLESLHNPDLRPWIQTLLDWVAGATLGMAQKLRPLTDIVKWFVPKEMRDAEATHRSMTQERLQKRLGTPNAAHVDLISNIDQFLSNDKLTSAELLESCRVMLVGGAGTIATVVSGMLYYLLSSPSALSTLKAEIRSEFNATDEINGNSVQKLTYLSAVIKEALRMFTPLPANLRRITPPEGCVIGGQFVPGETSVGVHLFAANLSSQNFNKLMEFRPERWFSQVPKEFQSDNRLTMQPLSTGPRNCIAKNLALMEMQLILAKLVFRFDLELAEESRLWVNEVKVSGFVQKPKLMVKLAAV
ncbi:cytochrome P450, partial [Cadophora sp. DSE1049]